MVRLQKTGGKMRFFSNTNEAALKSELQQLEKLAELKDVFTTIYTQDASIDFSDMSINEQIQQLEEALSFLDNTYQTALDNTTELQAASGIFTNKITADEEATAAINSPNRLSH